MLASLDSAFSDRDDLNDGRESSRLTARLRVGISPRNLGLEILDRHARGKRHRLFAKAPDQKLIRRRHVEHELASLLEYGPVIGDEILVRCGRTVEMKLLPATRVVRSDVL